MADVAGTEALYDIAGTAADPLYQFNVNQSINQETATIDGWEIGGQYFFGESGFGVLANYTMVNGDVGFDNTGADEREPVRLAGPERHGQRRADVREVRSLGPTGLELARRVPLGGQPGQLA